YIQSLLDPKIKPLCKPGQAPTLADGEPLKIGYLSSDLHDHPVGRNVLPLFQHHDPQRVKLYAYVEGSHPDDPVAEALHACVAQWRPIQGISDGNVARLIHNDGVHVLVVLAAMFDKNRPLIAAYRPAPIQVSFHNVATTGLEAMDYWLTDETIHPEADTRELFTEALYRLPVFYNYPEPEQAPDVGPLPMDKNHFVTFGSLNNPGKINHQVVDLWAEILTALPDARLMLKYRQSLEDPPVRARILDRFASHGVESKRLELVSALDDITDHLTHYQRIDIALDPFPFTGATTTFQALWMGVPVVALAGENFIGRMATDILAHAGLKEPLLAESKKEYLEKAVALANNPNALREMRLGLRQRIQHSPLLDGAGHARSVEDAYWAMWRQR
ncbi:MAG: hypothetical protein HQL53_14095, partial [Magnetococcales bacterium]|nr:hypothetical protein [Magnetococcales bacterium]